jgi:hypothetical protein
VESPIFEFEFETTPEDIEHNTHWLITQGPPASQMEAETRRANAGLRLLMIAGVVGACAGCFLALVDPEDPTWTTTLFIGGGLALSLIAFLFHRQFLSQKALERYRHATVKAAIARASGASLIGRYLVRTDRSGFLTDSPLSVTHRRWFGVLDCVRTERWFLLPTIDESVVGVPLRAFTDDAHRDRFEHAVRGWIAHASTDRPGSIIDRLAEHDVPCPGCGYNLRGLRATSCPECSMSVIHAVIPHANSESSSPPT